MGVLFAPVRCFIQIIVFLELFEYLCVSLCVCNL